MLLEVAYSCPQQNEFQKIYGKDIVPLGHPLAITIVLHGITAPTPEIVEVIPDIMGVLAHLTGSETLGSVG